MFEDKIKWLREGRKMRQEDVAKAIGITKSTYIKYEKGTQSLQLEVVEKIARLYGVSVSELVGGEKPSLNEQLNSRMELIDKLEDEEKINNANN
ncbi:helix-turn-helix domain-containing protein [Vibrio bathopelagicus]|uniref:helix-turn-helix domain-containing protein n=1 Tax=Vibrio bathopelagicus TaxID=2777577 RepID=UPI001CF4456F|nr:helix-turn-helix transcriptional regulator [Vibrio bathopelagicus]